MASDSAPRVNHAFLDEIGPEQAWVLGILASDGCVQRGRHITLGQSGANGREILDRYAEVSGFTGAIRDRHAATIFFTSRRWAAVLREHGIVERKSLTLRFPDGMSNYPHLRHFVAGYVDGDGSVGVYRNTKGAATLSVSLVGTREFIDGLSVVVPVRPSGRTHITRARNCHELRWYGTNAAEFGEWMWGRSPVHAGSKYRIFRAWADTDGARILSARSSRAQRRASVRDAISSGNTVAVASRITGVPFQTIYKWLAEGAV